MKKVPLAAVGILVFSAIAVQANQLQEEAQDLFEPIPFGIPEMENNPATQDKIDLGKILFFDPRLSKSGLISCNTCHNIGMGGDDFQETSTGHGWQKGPRNSPTVLNAVYNVAQFWDGRAADLKEQAKGPVQASVEMNNTPEGVLNTLNSIPRYKEMFAQAFPGEDPPVTFDNMAAAIEVFEATLTTPDSRFDRFIRGHETALDETEQQGLKLFIDNGCTDCHAGRNMGGDAYFAFGVTERPDSELLNHDKGRYMVTKMEEDTYVFKAPSLRNIELTPPYFHSGKVWSLKDAVTIMGSSQLGIEFGPQDAGEITAFLRTTTGRQPKVEYPLLPPSTNDTPKPVLD